MAWQDVVTQYMPLFKIGLFIFVFLIIMIVGYWYFFIYKRQRRWHVEVHEQKADGKLHTVGKDTLIEKKKKFGTMVYYWMKRAKQEAVPPPSVVVDRWNGKEEVDYLRIERDLVPAEKKALKNYTKPEYRAKLVEAHDTILKKIKSIKIKWWNAKPVHDRWIYIPVERTLCAKVEYTPIPFDMNMMAVNEINNADQHFSSQYEWWKKYGAIIVFAATIIFLLIIAVLTYQHLEKTSAMWVGKLDQANGILQNLADKVGAGTAKPPS